MRIGFVNDLQIAVETLRRAIALDAADTPVVGSADLRGAAARCLRKIRNIGWLIGRYGSRPRRYAGGPAQRTARIPGACW